MENVLLQIQTTIESIQKIVETNQKDYTDTKFQQLQNAFEQLKQYVASEIEHSEDIQDQKEKFSLLEFKSLTHSVDEYSKNYENRITKLEDDHVTADTVEHIIVKRFERKWVERGIYVVFFLTLLISGFMGFQNLSSDFSSFVTLRNSQSDIIKSDIKTMKSDIKKSKEDILTRGEDSDARINDVLLLLEKLKGIHNIP